MTNTIKSRVPGKVTNGALNRKRQWKGWWSAVFDDFMAEAADLTGKTRKCVSNKFPHDSPGDLDKVIIKTIPRLIIIIPIRTYSAATAPSTLRTSPPFAKISRSSSAGRILNVKLMENTKLLDSELDVKIYSE